VNEFHHEDGLADARAAEHCRLAALGERSKEVDHLDTGDEGIGCAALVSERRWRSMDRTMGDVRGKGAASIADFSRYIEQAAENGVAHRHGERTARSVGDATPLQAGRRLKRNRADCPLVDMGLDLRNDIRAFGTLDR
jgi:hypothetical protein